MSMFSPFLDGTTLTVKSPDHKIIWELQDGRDVEMWFEGDALTYRRYTEAELGRQLSGLFASMWAAHRSAERAVLTERRGHPVSADGPANDQRSREFINERTKLRTRATSKSGDIEISAVGMRSWAVQIRSGTLSVFDQEQFLQDLWSAFVAHMTDYRVKVTILKDQFFDTGIEKYQRRLDAVDADSLSRDRSRTRD